MHSTQVPKPDLVLLLLLQISCQVVLLVIGNVTFGENKQTHPVRKEMFEKTGKTWLNLK